MRMSINLGISHLRSIVAIADYASFTSAAHALDVSQSSLSRSVAEAERRLDVTLFERTTRRVELTTHGHEIIEHARRMLHDFDDGLTQIERFVTGDRGIVTVACLPSLAATFLPPYVVSFREQHPDVRLQIRDGLRQEVLDAVYSGTVDLALVTTSGILPGLQQDVLTSDSFYCAVAPTHPFADRPVLRWSDLAGQPFIAFGPESSIAAPVRRAVEDARIELGPVTQAQNIGAVAGLAAAGLGVTAVPELVLPMISFAGLVHIPLQPTVERTISLVQVAGRPQTASTRGFVNMLLADRTPDRGAASG
ncbi:putative HTH-type transcriptional regulator ybhD [Rhodococcus opacus PD630]|nr:putative HTH-type transcriptional regulator ybhD [Rhodococcus opacus PD630]